MEEKPKYAIAYGHLEAAAELADRVFAHLVMASRAGADTFEIQLAADELKRMIHAERKAMKTKFFGQTEKEENDEDTSFAE